MFRFFSVITVFILATAPSYAGQGMYFLTGNQLKSHCEDGNAVDLATCGGYVQGVFDEFEIERAGESKSECVPEGVVAQQVVDIALKYINEHPQYRQLQAAALIHQSLVDAWKCK
jgi:phage protein U